MRNTTRKINKIIYRNSNKVSNSRIYRGALGGQWFT